MLIERRNALVVSYLGYETRIISSRVETNVGLTPDLNVLGEVVVSSGVIDIAKVRETSVAYLRFHQEII